MLLSLLTPSTAALRAQECIPYPECLLETPGAYETEIASHITPTRTPTITPVPVGSQTALPLLTEPTAVISNSACPEEPFDTDNLEAVWSLSCSHCLPDAEVSSDPMASWLATQSGATPIPFNTLPPFVDFSGSLTPVSGTPTSALTSTPSATLAATLTATSTFTPTATGVPTGDWCWVWEQAYIELTLNHAPPPTVVAWDDVVGSYTRMRWDLSMNDFYHFESLEMVYENFLNPGASVYDASWGIYVNGNENYYSGTLLATGDIVAGGEGTATWSDSEGVDAERIQFVVTMDARPGGAAYPAIKEVTAHGSGVIPDFEVVEGSHACTGGTPTPTPTYTPSLTPTLIHTPIPGTPTPTSTAYWLAGHSVLPPADCSVPRYVNPDEPIIEMEIGNLQDGQCYSIVPYINIDNPFSDTDLLIAEHIVCFQPFDLNVQVLGFTIDMAVILAAPAFFFIMRWMLRN